MQTYKLLEEDVVHLLQPTLVKTFGRVGAQFMNQLHYWLHKCGNQTDGRKWYYQTSEAWADQLNISSRHFRRIIKDLQEKALITIAKLSPHKSNRTNHYSINYDVLETFLTAETPPPNKNVADKMSAPSGQNVRMVKKRLTNQENNKSTLRKIFKHISRNSLNNPPEVPSNNTPMNSLAPIQEKSLELSKSEPAQAVTFPNQQMIALWNEAFHTNLKITKRLAKLCNASLSLRFENKIENFQTYLQQIKTSNYLTSEAFDLKLDWALQFTTIDKIQSGHYGVKKAVSNVFEKKIPIDTAAEIETIQTESREGEGGEEKQFRLDLMQKIGVVKYVSWMKLVNLTITPDGEVKVKAANAFMQHRVENLIAQSGCTPKMQASNRSVNAGQGAQKPSPQPSEKFMFMEALQRKCGHPH